MENPPGSYIWKFPPLASPLASLGMDLHTAICHRCGYEPDRKRSKVRLHLHNMCKFVTTGAWIQGARRLCKCPDRKHMIPTKEWVKSGKRRIAGRHALLTRSAAHPHGLRPESKSPGLHTELASAKCGISCSTVHSPRCRVHSAESTMPSLQLLHSAEPTVPSPQCRVYS